jgi:ribosome maturation factor RimP
MMQRLFSLVTFVSAIHAPSQTAVAFHSPFAKTINKCFQPTRLYSSSSQDDVESDMQSLGTQMIIAAAKEAGATEPMIDIEWKTDRIVVTIDTSADENYDAGDFEEEEWEDVLYDIDVDGLIDEDDLASLDFDEEDDVFDEEDYEPSSEVSVAKIARTINEYLSRDGEGSLGDKIAQMHEIEVTTPEFDNVLRGERMFKVYKGFDVIVEHWEENKKKKDNAEDEETPRKRVVTEGKLVGRDMEKNRTTINVKGRNKNIKNELIESVKLPKAKSEKGAK